VRGETLKPRRLSDLDELLEVGLHGVLDDLDVRLGHVVRGVMHPIYVGSEWPRCTVRLDITVLPNLYAILLAESDQ
jgi:hypothetical protein